MGSSVSSRTRRIIGVGGVDPALGESQQREAGLRLAAELVGALIRGFGAIEVADEAEEVALDHAGAAERGGLTGAASRSHACRASMSASGHAPRSPSTSARCKKQWPR